MALYAEVNREGVHHLVLEEYQEGVYVLVFPTASNYSPSEDHLQNDWDMAKRSAMQCWGITEDRWKEIPDTGIMGEKGWPSKGGAYREE